MSSTFNPYTAEFLVKERKARNLSQTEVAKRAGMTREQLSAYENGRRKPKWSTLLKIANAIGCKAGMIGGYDPEDAPEVFHIDLNAPADSVVNGMMMKATTAQLDIATAVAVYKDMVDQPGEDLIEAARRKAVKKRKAVWDAFRKLQAEELEKYNKAVSEAYEKALRASSCEEIELMKECNAVFLQHQRPDVREKLTADSFPGESIKSLTEMVEARQRSGVDYIVLDRYEVTTQDESNDQDET